MRSTCRCLAYAFAAAAIAACSSTFYRPGVYGPGGRPQPTGPTPVDGAGLPSPGSPAPQGTGQGAIESRMKTKRVVAKDAPTTLIADDRSRCTVSERKFRDTEIGSDVLCDWRS